ncbi:glycosyltransferase family 4 protein [Candidatus Viridilinea mediisalina]|uniref:Glycosyl transferase family 1 n=1 Tax=Candidatus Viridilinea mediisalina TaxID=2024553 RepID=A0A2A6RDA1_9CHLR|nr:glycosyltransferase family 4 protein [Candidatus Viridilinea mediisalina]PDV98602.1 glycosyl transferase family 1 [Candidatus Viridilinea mediisalina]
MPTPRVAMLARVVFPLHGYGGIERHVFHLVTHLTRLGAEVTLFVQHASHERRDAHDAATQAITAGLKRVVYLRYDYTSPLLPPNGVVGRQFNYPWYTWELGRTVAHLARGGSFDVIHSQGLCAAGYGLIRSRDPLLQRIPFVANPHGMEEFRTPDWRKWLAYAPFRALYAYGHRVADRAIATDACTQDDLPRYLGVDPARIAVIPSAIDVEECLGYVQPALRQALRERFDLAACDLTFMSVGRLERNKGFHILIEALARLQGQLPPRWRWLLVGNGKERANLAQQAQQAGIAKQISFVGRLDDDELHSLYEEVDLVIHPTLYEGSSLVTLEGMIHRKPMIASAAGGIPDKVFNQRNGYLVPAGSVDALVQAMSQALHARAHWPAWGHESERIVRSTFDWPIVARQTLALYMSLMIPNPIADSR